MFAASRREGPLAESTADKPTVIVHLICRIVLTLIYTRCKGEGGRGDARGGKVEKPEWIKNVY